MNEDALFNEIMRVSIIGIQWLIIMRVFWTLGYSTGWVHHSPTQSDWYLIFTRWTQQFIYTAILFSIYLTVIVYGWTIGY